MYKNIKLTSFARRSVSESILWNIMYDTFFDMNLLDDTGIIEEANGAAIVLTILTTKLKLKF